MFASGTVWDDSGRAHPFHSGVTPHQACSLERICRCERSTTTLEVGLAYGSSALAILEGKTKQEGIHYAIDPFQSSQWGMLGAQNIRRAGFEKRFVLLQERDDMALPQLLGEGIRIDFAFIDGDHSLPATLLDWHYIDQLLVDRGMLVFHDYPLGGVYHAAAFALGSGRYERVTDWDLRRLWWRRLARTATSLVRGHNPIEAIAAAAANTQMLVLRKLS